MIRLSIIVPAVGDQAAIDATLVSVLENRPVNCEVIVACPESYQDPYDLDDEIHFVRCPDSAEPSYLLNRGIQYCRSELVHWLSPGVAVTDGWTESPVDQLTSREFDFISPLALSEFAASRISMAGIRYGRGGNRKIVGKNVRFSSSKSKRLKVDGPSMMAGFCLRASFLKVGGFSARFGAELADADLATRIVAANMTCAVNTSCCVMAGYSPFKTSGGFRHGRHAERLYWRHAKSSGRASLLNHSAIVLLDTIRQMPRPASVTSLLGRLAGAIDSLRPYADDNGLDSNTRFRADVATRNAA